MKLSDAILKGCKGTVKIGYYFTTRGHDSLPDNGCCVMGAALVGTFGLEKAKDIDGRNGAAEAIEKEFGVEYDSQLIQTAVSRNNLSDESRESIAAWLASKGL